MEMPRKILIPLVDPTQVLPYLKLAAALAPSEGKILVLRVVEIPEDKSLSIGAETAPVYRAALEDITSQFPDERVEVRTLVRVSHRLSEGIAETAKEEACDLLILPWKGYTVSQDRFFGKTIDPLLERPPCRTLVVRAGDLSGCRRILLPVRGGPHAELALEIGSRLALSMEAEVTVLHCEQRFSAPGFGDRAYRLFLRRLQFHPRVRRLIDVKGEAKEAIIQEAKAHDMVILGAAFNPEPHGHFFGPVVEHVAQQTDKPLVVVKTPSEAGLEFKGAPAETRDRPLSERVDKWFAENTFHRREFDDVSRLAELKEKQGLTISLGLPALNEAETIGNVIRTVKERLCDQTPLLDEIVLIDSGSTDDTVRIAKDLGIPVYVHQEILPPYGSYRGKGEALWKSLYVLKGDIIVWIDTDIKNIHPGFVYGILGPLLKEPAIQYVKGFYRRPLKAEGKTYAEGGGRVTELTARPFLNLFFPELSGIIQPLAGEYGGRREALEGVPFFTGYGVETGLLIDLFEEFGLRAIAQVDLEERIHRNQPLSALSQMSFAIIRVFVQRLEEKNRMRLLEEVNQSMKLIKHRRESYALEVKDIGDHERPPMISIPEYQALRQKTGSVKDAQEH
jgi:glucosyl-3-phosphoglycerate synthase